jgi:hypothetical protein
MHGDGKNTIQIAAAKTQGGEGGVAAAFRGWKIEKFRTEAKGNCIKIIYNNARRSLTFKISCIILILTPLVRTVNRILHRHFFSPTYRSTVLAAAVQAIMQRAWADHSLTISCSPVSLFN